MARGQASPAEPLARKNFLRSGEDGGGSMIRKCVKATPDFYVCAAAANHDRPSARPPPAARVTSSGDSANIMISSLGSVRGSS